MSKDTRDFEQRYAACFVDFSIKTASGLLIGAMLGSFFLGSRKWPSIIGGGMGFGMAYSNCENSLNNYLRGLEPKPCVIKKKP